MNEKYSNQLLNDQNARLIPRSPFFNFRAKQTRNILHSHTTH